MAPLNLSSTVLYSEIICPFKLVYSLPWPLLSDAFVGLVASCIHGMAVIYIYSVNYVDVSECTSDGSLAIGDISKSTFDSGDSPLYCMVLRRDSLPS